MDNEELRNIWIKGLEKKDSEKAPESEDLVSIWEKVTNKISDIQNSTPYPKYVKEKLDSFGNINDKIKFLQLVIAKWEVNASTFILEQDLTGWDKEVVENSKNRHIELYSKWLDYLKFEKGTQDEEGAIPEESNSAIGNTSSKVATVAIMELLKAAGINKSNTDLSKIIRIVSFLLGKSYKGLYNDANKGITFNASYHKKDIDEVNRLFSDANIPIKIDIDKKY